MSDTELDFERVMARFGNLIDAVSDREILSALDLRQSAYSQRKSRNAIPFEALILACQKRGIRLDDVFGSNELANDYVLDGDQDPSRSPIEHQLLCGMLLDCSDTDLNKVGMRIQRIAGALNSGVLSKQRILDAVALSLAFEKN